MTSTRVHDQRLQRLCELLRQHDIDIAVVTTPESVLYLTGIDLGGFWSPQYLIVNRDGDHAYVLRGIEIHWCERWGATSWCTNWTPYFDDQDSLDVASAQIHRLLGGRALRTLACELERPSLPYATVERWRSELQPTSVVSAAGLVEEMRVIKSVEEITFIQRAGEITASGMHAAVDQIAAGGTDAAAVADAFSTMYANGSEFLADNPFVAIGPESAMAHARSANRRPESGEVVPIMMSAAVRRYQCPVERTYVYGKPSTELQRLLDLVCDAAEAAIGGLRPGMTSAQADALARDVFERGGVADHFLNRLGYSFGLAYPPVWWENEIMQLRPGDDRTVREGMVFHLVPALHVPGFGFIQRSMPVTITSDGCEPLIDYPIRIDPIAV